MNTVNISLPKELYRQVDDLIREEGFASRSEFFRTLIRIYTTIKKSNVDLLPFETKSLPEIQYELENENIHNKKFVSSVMEGLSKSSVYANKTSSRRSTKASTKIPTRR